MIGKSFCGGDSIELRKVDRTEFASRLRGNGIVEIVATRVVENVPHDHMRMHIILVEQFRPAIGHRVIELPAGASGDHDDPNEKLESAVYRELKEETGYKPGKVTFLSEGPSSAGMSDEIVSFFLATDLEKVGSGGGVGDESIIVHEVPMITVNQWLSEKTSEGIMIDPRVWAGIYLRIAYLTGKPEEGPIQ